MEPDNEYAADLEIEGELLEEDVTLILVDLSEITVEELVALADEERLFYLPE